MPTLCIPSSPVRIGNRCVCQVESIKLECELEPPARLSNELVPLVHEDCARHPDGSRRSVTAIASTHAASGEMRARMASRSARGEAQLGSATRATHATRAILRPET